MRINYNIEDAHEEPHNIKPTNGTKIRANKQWQSGHKPPTKEKQSNQLSLPQQGDHNARQDPVNTTTG